MNSHIDWNTASELGIIWKINSEILHPLGMAMSRNPKSGHSEFIIVSTEEFEYPEEKNEYYKTRYDNIRQKITDVLSKDGL